MDIKIGHQNSYYTSDNIFNNSDIGIYSINSSLTAIKNTFQNLGSFNSPYFTFQGSGIYSNSAYDNNDRHVTIGTTINSFNTFTDSKFGAVLVGEANTTIEHNQFNSGISTISLALSSMGTKTYTVSDNDFNGFNTGVYIGGLGDAAHLTVTNNRFNTGQFYTMDNFSAAAIVALASAGGMAKNAVITYNEITDPRLGIYAINLPEAQIRFNTVTYATDAANPDNYGIEVVGSNRANVLDNIVTYMPTTTPTNTIKAISIESSQYALVSRNKTYETEIGMYVYGNCSNTELRCNEFHKDITGLMDIGVQLQDAGASSITLTQQGNKNDPWQNQWYGTFTPYRVGGSSAQFTWYWDQNNPTIYDPIPDPFIVNSLQTGLNGIDPCGMPDKPPGDERNERMTAVVNDTVIYSGVYSNENRYKDMQAVYGLMKMNDSIITQGNADDLGYEFFYNTMQQSNIEQLQAVDSLITIDDDTNALVVNTNVVDTNLHETNRKLYNEIYLRTLAIGEPLTVNDSSILYSIATQRITEGGDAVSLARAALFLEIHETPPLAARIGKISNEVQLINAAILYPNPAKDYIVLNTSIKEGEKLLVCDASGLVKFVLKFNKDENSCTINTRQLSQGTYLLKFASRPKQDALTFTVIR